jgi:hypothetical protein
MRITIRDPAPCAQRLRPGAVVSLHSVLGDAGILQGPTPIIFAAVPVADGAPLPPAETIEIPRPSGKADRLDSSAQYPRATAEAALCHWIWLVHAGRLLPPSPESDIEDLDRDRLCRLAAAAGIEAEVRAWIAESERYAEEVLDYCPGLGF